jgi:hypothetical protein
LKLPAGTSTAAVIVAFFSCNTVASDAQDTAACAAEAAAETTPAISQAGKVIRNMSFPPARIEPFARDAL